MGHPEPLREPNESTLGLQRVRIPPGNCRSSRYVEFGVMLSWTGKPLPYNAFGGFYST